MISDGSGNIRKAARTQDPPGSRTARQLQTPPRHMLQHTSSLHGRDLQLHPLCLFGNEPQHLSCNLSARDPLPAQQACQMRVERHAQQLQGILRGTHRREASGHSPDHTCSTAPNNPAPMDMPSAALSITRCCQPAATPRHTLGFRIRDWADVQMMPKWLAPSASTRICSPFSAPPAASFSQPPSVDDKSRHTFVHVCHPAHHSTQCPYQHPPCSPYTPQNNI